MKKINSFFGFTTGLTVLILALGLQLNAMPILAAPQDAAQPPQTDKMQPPSDTEKATVFTGKVMKAKGVYVLMDDNTKVTYALDDQEKAKSFNGKTVKVTGTLETASNTIHIANIEPAA